MMFPKIGIPQNGWFIMENPIKIRMIWGVFPLFLETPICTYIPGPSSLGAKWLRYDGCLFSTCFLGFEDGTPHERKVLV